MIVSIRRKNESLTPRVPEVVTFKEPGLGIRNKMEGSGRSKSVMQEREKRIEKKVERLHKKERNKGNALPATLKEIELTSALRNEVFEFGASAIAVEDRGKALEKWRKRQRRPHEMIQKWQTETQKTQKKKSYPQLMEEVYEEKAQKFANEEKRFQGDDMVRDFDKRGRKRKTVDLPSKLYSKHLSRTKAGKFRDGVLQLTNQDVRKVKFQARKKSRR